MQNSILVLNTGSTSTKIALYLDEKPAVQKEIRHDREFLSSHPFVADQFGARKELVREFIQNETSAYAPYSAIVSRGGILPPLHSGGYVINAAMCDYLANVCNEEHASNISALIAFDIAKEFNIPHAYIYDAITTDELDDIARVSGIPELPRRSRMHALNMRAMAIKSAAMLDKPYEKSTIIVAHLGGGISLSIHVNGKAADIVSDDEGPFSPERVGRQQAIEFMKFIDAKEGTAREKMRLMRGKSGFAAYFGTSDSIVVEKMAEEGDKKALLIFEAMAYQISKSIGELATVTCGAVDCITLTGGLARSKMLTNWICQRTEFIAPVYVLPGENEMESLAHGALRILRSSEEAREFTYEK